MAVKKSSTQNKSRKGGSKSGRAWKQERATVHRKAGARPKSNKYSESDAGKKPASGERERVWVGGYTRKDGVKVQGHYRDLDTGGRAGSSGGGMVGEPAKPE